MDKITFIRNISKEQFEFLRDADLVRVEAEFNTETQEYDLALWPATTEHI